MTENKTTQPPAEPAIDSVFALTKAYPELIEQLIKATAEQTTGDVRAEVEAMSPAAFRQAFPKLAAKLGAKLAEPAPAGLDPKKGFILAIGDPFAAGTERVYARLHGRPPRSLPCLLPFTEAEAAEALASYRVRAAGAGDRVRAANADLALERCKK